MAKKRTSALLDFRSEHESHNKEQGIGHFVPESIPMSEYKKVRKLWEKKLRDSGFPEIEQFSTDCTGHFSPFFIKSRGDNSLSGSSATVARLYKPENAEYYRRFGLFFHHADLWYWLVRAKRKHPRHLKRKSRADSLAQTPARVRYLIYYHIIRLRKDGATYETIRDFFNSSACPKCVRKFRKNFTTWFVYYRVLYLEKIVAEWFRRFPSWLEG